MIPFVDLIFLIFHQGLRDMTDVTFSDFSSEATRYDSLKVSDFSSGATRYGKSENLSEQMVPHILLDCDFPYCGLGRGFVFSEGFSRFPSPHSLVGTDEFVPKSIVPTVELRYLSCRCGGQQ